MQYKIDKRSGNKLSILGFGCMRFPGILGKIDLQKTEEMIMRSIERGLNYFDTAWLYPGSEEILGDILEKNNVRKKVFIATKLPLVITKKTEDFDKYFYQSLERLKTDYIDYYLMHMITDLDHWQKLKSLGIEKWIAEKKKLGKIKQIGFSFHGSGSEFLKIIDDYDWEFTMIQYNYFDENFQAGVKGLRAAAAKMPVMIMEPLFGGKLVTGLPVDAVKIFKKADPKLSPAGWALNWIWNQNEPALILSGMSNMEQLEENLQFADIAKAGMYGEAEKAVYADVLRTIKRTNKVNCSGCNYCMPCPVGVNIPEVFSSYNTIYSMGYITGMKSFVMSTGLFSEKSAAPSRCIRCGKCVPKCPQNIPVMKHMIEARRKMEPWWIRFVGVCARSFMGKKRKPSSRIS